MGPQRQGGGAKRALEPAGRTSEPAGRVSEPYGRASEPSGRGLEPAGMARGTGKKIMKCFPRSPSPAAA